MAERQYARPIGQRRRRAVWVTETIEVPMRATRRQALIESVVNVAVGLGLSLAVQVALFAALRVPISIHQNVLVVLAMTALSLGRSYCLRMLFGWWWTR